MRPSALWSHPEFLKLWTAYTVSRLGSQITLLALPLSAVLLLGAGPTETGPLVAALFFLVTLAPAVTVSPAALVCSGVTAVLVPWMISCKLVIATA